MDQHISVREITLEDIPQLINYWQNATPEFLLGMGADPALQPDQDEFKKMLQHQITLPYTEKQSYCTIWLLDNKAIGHCNVNKIIFGEEASMHLHLWQADKRQSGLGIAFVKLSMQYFFRNLQLKTLYCEPYALNPAPNHTLKKLGFEFVEEYVTTPGAFCFEQSVKKWEMSKERFELHSA